MQFINDENENTGSGRSRHHVPETTTRARTTSLQGPLSLSPSLPPELPPKKSRKHLPPPPPPSQSVRSRPALPLPAPSHGQYFQQRHQQPGGCNGNGSNSDAITTPMHAWPNSGSSSSNNGFIGSSSHNKRQTSVSSSSSTSSSTLAREDRATVKQQFTLPETFVDEGVSFVRFATSKSNSLYPVTNGNNGNNNNNNLNRSASSVTSRTKAKAPIAKPVRRSKSQLVQPRNYVTSIQHGGAVTLVSLSSDSSSSSGHSDRFLTTQHVHHHHHFVEQEDLELEWHRGKTEIPAFQVK